MLQPGTMIGTRYQVLRLLGQGGMSNIYVCQDTRLRGKTWVVKEMTARYSDPHEQSTALKYFEREAHLLAHLHHPNLPTVNDYFSFQNRYYLVMEHVEGEDLGKMLARVGGPLPERQVAEMGVQMATVLYYLHCQKPEPIIFRDVKPSNIMLAGAGVKLIDFGIARHFNPAKKGDTMRIGSPGYAPPEQYAGQTDPRSDVYALGVTMHQALTGRDPTTTQTPFHVPPVRGLNPKVSEEMARIIERATKIDPDERYQSMLDMKRDLQALVAQHRGGTSVVRTAPDGTGPTPAPAAAPPAAAPVPVAAAAAAGPSKKPAARRKGPSLARLMAVMMVLASLGLTAALVGKTGTVDYVKDLLAYILPHNAPTHTGGASLYLGGSPLGEVFAALARERRESPASAEVALYWNNALAGLESDRVLVLGAVVPEGEAWDPAVRGLALAQRALNGLGGVQDRLVVLVLERVPSERLATAVARVAGGKAGRQTEDERGTHGQPVEALLVFGEDKEVQEVLASTWPVPVIPVSGEGAQALPDPGAGFGAAVAAVAGGRPVVVFEPALEAELKGAKVPVTREAPPGSAELATALAGEHGKDLVALGPSALPEAALAALLKGPAEVLLLADDAADLPKATGPHARALVRWSPFHPWRAGADLARLESVLFPAGPGLDPRTARAYDGLRWVAEGRGAYRGATFAAAREGPAAPAPLQLFEATAQGWVFRRGLEAPQP